MAKQTQLAVFLSSAENTNPLFLDAIHDLAQLFAQEKITLVYGGSTDGLMGQLANAAIAAGVEVIGVFPTHLHSKETPHPGLTRIIEVSSFAERIAVMQDIAEGFMVLPGGLGTLEELFIVWNQIRLGAVSKPLGIVNCGAFYSPLQHFLFNDLRKENFVSADWLKIPLIANDVKALYKLMSPRLQTKE